MVDNLEVYTDTKVDLEVHIGFGVDLEVHIDFGVDLEVCTDLEVTPQTKIEYLEAAPQAITDHLEVTD